MKKIVLFLCIIPFIASARSAKMTELYYCVNMNKHEFAEGAKIFKGQYGNGRPFYEVEVLVLKYGKSSSYTKRVNLRNKYEGRIQEFTTGGFRIKVDRVQKDQHNRYRAFARIPDQDVHSRNWSCKDSL